MELKRENRILIWSVIILIFITILVLVKVLFTGSEGFEWGSVSDWVSATCNMAMAGAALYAAYNAKDWLKIKKKESSLPLLAQFHGNHIIPLSDKVREMLLGLEIAANEVRIFHSYDDLYEWRASLLNASGIIHKKDIQEYIGKSWSIYHDFYMNDVVQLYKSESLLKMYGWEFENKKQYDSLRKKKVDFFESAVKLLNDYDNFIAITYQSDKVLKHRSKQGDDKLLFNKDLVIQLHAREKVLHTLEDEIKKLINEIRFDIWK
ncbi:hypothetical protein ACHQIU_22170 [Raoultella planticola]|uniref:hypothetical protein n=1 Tax=Raoultella planticola TaxID=575 RepID=UPI00398209F3